MEQTFLLTHFVIMLSTLDFLNVSSPPYNTFFWYPLSLFFHIPLPMDSLSLSLHTIMFYSAIFLSRLEK
jgi:hypothetical protein